VSLLMLPRMLGLSSASTLTSGLNYFKYGHAVFLNWGLRNCCNENTLRNDDLLLMMNAQKRRYNEKM